MRRILLVVAWTSLLIAASCTAQKTSSVDGTGDLALEPEPSASVLRDIPYTREVIAFQELDLYLPATEGGPRPTILAIHGGGFRARSKALYSQIAPKLMEEGYAVVATNYRLTPTYSYPAQVEDVFCALGWVYANQERYGFDTEHVFVMGDSAGGYLAAMLATVDEPDIYKGDCAYDLPDRGALAGAIVLYGFFDLTDLSGHREADVKASLEPFMGGAHNDISPGLLVEMSPLSWIDGGEPPFLIIHGTQDRNVQATLSKEFAAALDEADVDVRLVLPEAEHGFILQPLSSPSMSLAFDSITSFVEEIARH